MAYDPEKQRKHSKNWRAANPDHARALNRKYKDEFREKDPEGYRASRKAEYTLRRERHPGRDRENFGRWYRAYKYGLGPEQYDAMLVEQNGCCAICNAPFTKRAPSVDHDHENGLVRALLCAGCNIRVGVLEHPLRAAAEAYIALWKTRHDV